jgi:hypothetical protein
MNSDTKVSEEFPGWGGGVFFVTMLMPDLVFTERSGQRASVIISLSVGQCVREADYSFLSTGLEYSIKNTLQVLWTVTSNVCIRKKSER